MVQLLFILAIVIAFALWLSPETRAAVRLRLSSRLLSYAGLGLLALLIATGRLSWIAGLILGAVLLGRRLPPKLHELIRNGPNRRTSGHPHLQTNNLAFRINRRSGWIDGTILGGHWQGRCLSRLTLDELLALRSGWLTRDSEAAALLTAYLDQAHTSWRAYRANEDISHGQSTAGVLSEVQAYALLGLANGADQEQIIAAHRRLMQQLHPDRGGSGYLAARLNEAKAQLLQAR